FEHITCQSFIKKTIKVYIITIDNLIDNKYLCGISLISFYQRGFETIPSKIKTMEECIMEKAIVVFSGGQDSTTCLLWAIKEFEEVEAVTFLYGQRHKLEVECSKKIAKDLGVKQKIIRMDLLNQLTENALTRKNMEIE